jgi:predicted amidophosphoribosyltransferase
MDEEQVETTRCPYCKEDIRADAALCKHCRSRLGAPVPEHGGICPYCREGIHSEATRCKHCGSDLEVRATSGCGCAPQAESRYVEADSFRDRGQFGGRLAGQCYNRCRMYCGAGDFYCHLLCNFICEGAPVTERPFVIR